MGGRVAKFKSFTRTPTAAVKSFDKVLESKTVSPRHPSTIKVINEFIEANPEVQTATKEKNENLHKMLENIRVDSYGVAPDQVLRTGVKAEKLKAIPEGKLSYEQLEQLLINRKCFPEVWTDKHIAEHFKLDEHVAKNLTTYFSSFRIFKDPVKE